VAIRPAPIKPILIESIASTKSSHSEVIRGIRPDPSADLGVTTAPAIVRQLSLANNDFASVVAVDHFL
jgi:hypothetical protein